MPLRFRDSRTSCLVRTDLTWVLVGHFRQKISNKVVAGAIRISDSSSRSACMDTRGLRMRATKLWPVWVCVLIGFLVFSSSAIYSQGDGSGNVKILNERIKRTSPDKVRFRVKLTNESRSAILGIGIT